MAQQPTPYLGSKISLISKSEIRYEGILYTVDQKEATIALAKVKSFGTEDRPTEHPVAPREDVYEYIIFKASDIKDLMVCETPKPVPQLCPGLPYDPAIVSVSQASAPNQSLVSGIAGGAGSTSFPSAGKAPVGSGSSTRSGTPGQRSGSPTVETGTQAGASSHNKAPGAGRHTASAAGRPQRRQTQPHQTRASAPLRTQDRGGGRQQGQGTQSYRNAVVGNQQQGRGRYDGNYRGGYEYGRRAYDQRSPGAHYYTRGQGGQRGTPARGVAPRRPPAAAQPLKFDSDYDFEKANEQFQETLHDLKEDLTKVKLSDEEEAPAPAEEKEKEDSSSEAAVPEEAGDSEEKTPFYDQHSSFFDRISCEALERQEGKNDRPNWRKERETNMETFGQAALRNYQYRRGGGRGMGYQRGGYGGYYRGRGQGRGYYGGYNNYYGRGGYYQRY